jgi:hypothetical protein
MSAPIVVSSEECDANLSSEISNVRADLLNAGTNNTSALLQSQSADVKTVLQNQSGNTASVIATSERQSYHTQAGVDRSGYNQSEATNSGFFESRNLTQNGAVENRETTQANHIEGRSQLNNSFFELRNAINNGFTAGLLASKDAQLAIALSEGSVRRQVSDVAGLLNSQLTSTKEALSGLIGNLAVQNQLELSKYFAIAERENNKQFALATLAASTNAAKIESDLAECCCEIKEVVNSSANATQALVQANETNRVRDELEQTQQDNVVLQVRSRC